LLDLVAFSGAFAFFGDTFRTGRWWNGTRCAYPLLHDIAENDVGIIRCASRPHSGQGVGSSDCRSDLSASNTLSQLSQ
jgi:hypothetical protein